MALGPTLNRLRMKKGESLQEVADAIGVSKTHVWELEKQRTQNPSIELIRKLADHFQVTVSSLLGEATSTSADEQAVRMFRQIGALDGKDKDILDDMLQSLLRRSGKADDRN